MLKSFVLTAVLLAGGPVLAQSTKPGATQGAMGQGGASGQQLDQSIPNQNQSQMQTNDSQQPPQVKVLPPSASAQAQPNPHPALSR